MHSRERSMIAMMVSRICCKMSSGACNMSMSIVSSVAPSRLAAESKNKHNARQMERMLLKKEEGSTSRREAPSRPPFPHGNARRCDTMPSTLLHMSCNRASTARSSSAACSPSASSSADALSELGLQLKAKTLCTVRSSSRKNLFWSRTAGSCV